MWQWHFLFSYIHIHFQCFVLIRAIAVDYYLLSIIHRAGFNLIGWVQWMYFVFCYANIYWLPYQKQKSTRVRGSETYTLWALTDRIFSSLIQCYHTMSYISTFIFLNSSRLTLAMIFFGSEFPFTITHSYKQYDKYWTFFMIIPWFSLIFQPKVR